MGHSRRLPKELSRSRYKRTFTSPYYQQLTDGQWKNGIPIEVTPFAYAKVLLNLADLGSPYNIEDGLPGLRLRMGKMKAGPVVSDNGNFIIDAPFPEAMMKDPVEVSNPSSLISILCQALPKCSTHSAPR